MVAAALGKKECLLLLIEAGCNLEILNNERMSPAMFAAWNGQQECLVVLINAGCEMGLESSPA